MKNLSTMFKALGDSVRLRLFVLLSHRDEVCVCDLVAALAMPQSTISRHLSVLRHAGLVAARREGKWMYYRLESEYAFALLTIIIAQDETVFEADKIALQQTFCD